MAFGNLTVNQGTNQGILVDQAGTSDIGVVKIDLASSGTYGTLWGGNVGVSSGTISSDTIVGGTLNAGTFQSSGGTLGSVIGIGSVSGLSNLPGGSIAVTAGTIGTVLSVGTLPNIPGGSIVVTAGTFVGGGGSVISYGPAGTGVAAAGNPLNIGGTDSGGTIRTILVDSTGVQRSSGSVVMTVGTVSVLPNLPQGSINVTAGTIGTILSVGTLPNIPGGSIAVTAGTFVGNGGSMIAYGPAAAAAAAAGNPLNIGGTDSGGTIRTILVDSTGVQRSSGSMVMTVGTVTVLPNLPQGSINVTAGTIGTVTGVGVVTSITNLAGGTLGILTNGTLSSSGTTTGVGSVSSLGSLAMLTAGTISMINAGTINAGTLSPIPTIANVTYGTHGTTGASIFGTLAGGTGSGAGTEIFCTSVSLSVPSTAGSQAVSIGWGTNGGTIHAGTGLIVQGNFPPGGGIQKTFWPPINSGTQAQLCLFQAGAGTVDVSVTYFITASTL